MPSIIFPQSAGDDAALLQTRGVEWVAQRRGGSRVVMRGITRAVAAKRIGSELTLGKAIQLLLIPLAQYHRGRCDET